MIFLSKDLQVLFPWLHPDPYSAEFQSFRYQMRINLLGHAYVLVWPQKTGKCMIPGFGLDAEIWRGFHEKEYLATRGEKNCFYVTFRPANGGTKLFGASSVDAARELSFDYFKEFHPSPLVVEERTPCFAEIDLLLMPENAPRRPTAINAHRLGCLPEMLQILQGRFSWETTFTDYWHPRDVVLAAHILLLNRCLELETRGFHEIVFSECQHWVGLTSEEASIPIRYVVQRQNKSLQSKSDFESSFWNLTEGYRLEDESEGGKTDFIKSKISDDYIHFRRIYGQVGLIWWSYYNHLLSRRAHNGQCSVCGKIMIGARKGRKVCENLECQREDSKIRQRRCRLRGRKKAGG